MKKYLIMRFFRLFPTLLGTMTILFFIFALMPADITSSFMPPIPREEKIKMRQELGLDKPKAVQFKIWLSKAIKGDFGKSFVFKTTSISDIIKGSLLSTLRITVPSLFIGIIFSIPLAVIAATKRQRFKSRIIDALSMTGLCLPDFFLAMILTLFFSETLNWLTGPASLIERAQGDKLAQHIFGFIAPVIVLSAYNIGLFTKFLKSSLVEVIHKDYIATARSKGLSERIVVYRHALKNALIPFVTILGTAIPATFAGSAIVETYFKISGMGYTMLQAVWKRDYYVLMGVYFVITVITLLSNFITDIIYGIIDPRVRIDR